MPLIYKITAVGHLPYFGSTTVSLGERYMGHLRSYYTNGSRCASADLFDLAKPENCRIELVEELPEDCTREQLLWRERHYIETNECVNIHKRPITTHEEYIKISKQYYEENKLEILTDKKEYYEDRKPEILTTRRQHYEENKIEILADRKKYGEENKSKILSKKKQYYEKNKERLKAKARARYAEKKAQLVFVSTETGA